MTPWASPKKSPWFSQLTFASLTFSFVVVWWGTTPYLPDLASSGYYVFGFKRQILCQRRRNKNCNDEVTQKTVNRNLTRQGYMLSFEGGKLLRETVTMLRSKDVIHWEPVSFSCIMKSCQYIMSSFCMTMPDHTQVLGQGRQSPHSGGQLYHTLHIHQI